MKKDRIMDGIRKAVQLLLLLLCIAQLFSARNTAAAAHGNIPARKNEVSAAENHLSADDGTVLLSRADSADSPEQITIRVP